MLRNLVYNSPADIDSALAWSGGALLGAARAALEACPGPEPGDEPPQPDPQQAQQGPSLRQHAVYVAVNVASGSPSHKDAVMASGWPALLLGALAADGDERVREAAVWAVINLTWRWAPWGYVWST